MKVSIIIPVYNVAPYIEDCLRSVMRQTYKGAMECIIVDDCGADDSMAIVERMVSLYEGAICFVILHHTHNRGLSAARNTGTEAAKGDYIYYLDSDDEITDDCIEKLLAKISEYPDLEMVQGNGLTILSKKNVKIQYKKRINSHATNNDEVRKCFHQLGHRTLAVWNKLIRRDFIINNNLLCKEGVVSEDILWSFLLIKYLNRAYFIDDVTYHYRMRSDSIVVSTPRRIKGESFTLMYTDILLNLTAGHEKWELDYYVKDIGYTYTRYAHRIPKIKKVFELLVKTGNQYGSRRCRLQIPFYSLLGKFKYGWSVCFIMRLLMQPQTTFRHICRYFIVKK